MSIYGNLIPSERLELEAKLSDQEGKVLSLFRARKGDHIPAFDVIDKLHMHASSVRRSLSNLSGSNEGYVDSFGQYPLVKTDVRKKDPNTGKSCQTYQFNERYGIALRETQMELL